MLHCWQRLGRTLPTWFPEGLTQRARRVIDV